MLSNPLNQIFHLLFVRQSKHWSTHWGGISICLFLSKKINQKRQNWVTPLGSQLVFGCRPALKSSFIDFFSCFRMKNKWKMYRINQKAENGQKIIITSFRVHVAPKSITCSSCLSICYLAQFLSLFPAVFVFSFIYLTGLTLEIRRLVNLAT